MEQNKRNTNDGKDRVSKILLGFYAVFLLLSIWIIIKIFYIQFIWDMPSNSLEEFIPNYKETVIEPQRGDILDCNGKILASSAPKYLIRMDCGILQNEFSNGKKVKVGKDSIGEAEWRELANKMCQELAAITKNGKTGADYHRNKLGSGK